MENQINNEKGKENKETLFEKGFNIFGGVLGIIFVVWFFGYAIKKEIADSSREMISLYIALITLYVFIFMSIIEQTKLNSDKADSEKKSLYPGIKTGENALMMCLILFLGIPLLVISIAILSFFLNFWYYIVALYVLAVLFMYIKLSKNIILKIIASLMVISSIYFGFKARNIIQFKFNVIYDNERIL